MAKSNHFGPLAAAAGALVAVALLVLMLVVVNPQTAEAAFPGANGRIAYVRSDGNDFEIFRATRFDFGAVFWLPFQITNNNTDDLAPVFSPDGAQIAYSGFDGNDFEIFRIPASVAGPPVQVTNNTTRNEYMPSWQPVP